jgi:hypothetical protein
MAGEERRIQGFDGETGGKKPLGRPRYKCEEDIEMDLQEMGLGHGLD